jgi:hypothetical protein
MEDGGGDKVDASFGDHGLVVFFSCLSFSASKQINQKGDRGLKKYLGLLSSTCLFFIALRGHLRPFSYAQVTTICTFELATDQFLCFLNLLCTCLLSTSIF